MTIVKRTALLLMLAAVPSGLAASDAGLSGAVQSEPASGTAAPRTATVIRQTELDRQVEAVSSELRCVVCQGLSIQDSPSTLAQEMRGVVREQLAAGRTPEQVKAYFVERYGEWVLLRPKASGVNLIVYLLPIAMVVGGAGFIVMKVRAWTRAAREGTI